MVFLFYPTDIIDGNVSKLLVILLSMLCLPSFRFSLRLRALRLLKLRFSLPLLNLRSLLLSLRLLNSLLRLLSRLLTLRLSLLPLNFLLGLLFWLLNLRLSLLLSSPLFMFLDARSPSIFILPLPSQFLLLLWWRGLIFFDIPFSFSFPISITRPASPISVKMLIRNPLVVPPMPTPIVISVVSSPTWVYIIIKIWDISIINPIPIIIT